MPKLTVENVGAFDVPEGKRLCSALEENAKVDQLHACGGNARCTTCRVEFTAGEPDKMTEAEKNLLAARGLSGDSFKLSDRLRPRHERSRHQPSGRQRTQRRRFASRRRHPAAARLGDQVAFRRVFVVFYLYPLPLGVRLAVDRERDRLIVREWTCDA